MNKHLLASAFIIVAAFILGQTNSKTPQLTKIIDNAKIVVNFPDQPPSENIDWYNTDQDLWVKINHQHRVFISIPSENKEYQIKVCDVSLDGRDVKTFIPGPWISRLESLARARQSN